MKVTIVDRLVESKILTRLPMRIDRMIESIENENNFELNKPRIYDFEIVDGIMSLYNKRLIDINFDRNGHPYVVYSNWSVVCPLRR